MIECPALDKIPDFRFEALEKEFIKDFMEICRILSFYPNREDKSKEGGRKLEQSYDIK